MADAPWDRQSDEPHNWYCRFEEFRRRGPGRSLLSVYNAERVKAGKGKSASPPSSWGKAAQRWRWRERAEAWDAEQARLARQAEAEALEARRLAWLAQAQALQGKACQRLVALDAGELSFRDVIAGVVEGVKLEMLARGEATERHDHSHALDDRRTRLDQVLAALRQRAAAGRA
jgi:hypothetical protein